MTMNQKLAYNAPQLVDLGDINAITEAVNVVGGGDQIFDVLNQS